MIHSMRCEMYLIQDRYTWLCIWVGL